MPSVLIPVNTRRDMVFDSARQLLYISTTNGRVERYDVQNRALLSPWTVGTSLTSADISLDGNSLYVGEAYQPSTVTVHKINLNTGAVTDLVYNTGDFSQGGVFDLAIAANGKAQLSLSFSGSGSTVPLELNTFSDTFSIRADAPDIFFGRIHEERIIVRSADRSLLLFAQQNLSPGPYWIYDSASDSFPMPTQTFVTGGLANLPLAISRDGSLIGIGRLPSNPPVLVYDRNVNFAHGYDANNASGGMTFDATRDVFYSADSASDTIVAIDSNTSAFLWRMPIDDNVGTFETHRSGEMLVSSDGRWLFMATNAGVRMYDVAGPPELTATDFASGEPGNSGSFITLSRTSLEPVTVDWATADGTALAGRDYIATSGRITFLPGETSQIVRVMVNADLLAEGDETFFINFSNPSVTMIDRQARGIIGRTLPMLEVNPDTALVEGDTGTTDAVFYLLLGTPSTQTVTINYSTADGPLGVTGARAGLDYTATSGSVVFQPGETLKTITVPVLGETEAEGDEHFFLNLSSTTAFVANPQVRGLIVANDSPTPLPSLVISDTTVTEGNTGTTAATLTVSLSEAAAEQVRVSYATGRASAYFSSPGFDYQSITLTTLTFSPGETFKVISVNVNGDTLDESDEFFFVNLLGAVGAQVADSQGRIDILDDDEAAVTIGDATVVEGDAGTVNVVFSVTPTTRSVLPILVTWTTADSSALAGEDYIATSGTLTIDPGQTVPQTITIPVRGDLQAEPDETFFVNLVSAVNAAIQDGQGIGMIVNDDRPRLSVDDASVVEGTGTSPSLVFTVRLSEPSGQQVTVAYATAIGTAVGDFFPTTSTLTFAPGELVQTVAVTVIGDVVDERDETFFLNLSGAVNAFIADSQGVGTIIDDDTAGISIDDVTINESPGGPATFTIRLATRSDRPIRVYYGTGDITAVAETSDFATTVGQVTFQPGETLKTITVTVNSDFFDEVDETFQVRVSDAGGVAPIVDGIGIGTIIDDDVSTLTISDASITEGNGGTLNLAFTVRRSFGSAQVITVGYATSNGTATTPGDYSAVSGTLTFAPSPTAADLFVVVPIRSDQIHEETETFIVNLSNAVNANISDGQAVGTIFDDDSAFVNIVPTTSAAEGNAGASAAVFTVTLSRPSEIPVTALYTTRPLTATADVDFQSSTASLTFAPGELRKTISIPLINDSESESNETFTLTLSNIFGATQGTSTATATILDDDSVPDTLRVLAFTRTDVGFTVLFDEPIDRTVLNLIDTETGGLGPADVTLVQTNLPAPLAVRGSVVVDPSGTLLTFVRTGGLLPAGTYAVTLRSAANGLRTPAGGLLDGNSDGVAGDDYTTTFTVPTFGFTIGIPDFARGPGQPVNLPANSTTGIPLRINPVSQTISTVSLTLRWDPALLTITGAAVPSGMPAGATVSTTFPEPGVLTLFFSTPTPLPAAPIDFVTLSAQVPASAPYGSKHVLDLMEPRLNVGFVNIREDDGVHVVGYPGDTTGNGGYSTADAQRTLRVALGLDGGFLRYPLLDPLLIADINGNGRVDSTDSVRIMQEALGIDRPEIPPLAGLPTLVFAGPDPLLSIPKTFRGRPGDTILVPVNLDIPDGLETVDLAIAYDARRLEVIDVQRGNVTGDFDLFAVNHDPEAGTIRAGLGRTAGPLSDQDGGSVLVIAFRIRPDAPAGRAVINLRSALGVTTTQLNEGYLDLNPDPSDEAGDVLDGVIAVLGPLRSRRVANGEPVGRRIFAALPPWAELVDAVFAGQDSGHNRNRRR